MVYNRKSMVEYFYRKPFLGHRDMIWNIFGYSLISVILDPLPGQLTQRLSGSAQEESLDDHLGPSHNWRK